MSVLKIHCVEDFGCWMMLSQMILFLNALYFFANDTCMFYKIVSLEGSVSHQQNQETLSLSPPNSRHTLKVPSHV